MTSDPDFKVTAFLKSNIGKILKFLKTKLLFHTNSKLYLTYGMVLCLVTSTDLETRRAGLSAETELLVKEIFRTAQPEARPEGPTAVWGS